MTHYYPYDPNSFERISETLTVEDGFVQLRHIPKKFSIDIEGFSETDSVSIAANQFRCDYSLNTYYREANRIVHFNTAMNGHAVTISYIAVGTAITADDMNEIKAHLESPHQADLPTASATIKGGIKVGRGLTMDGDTLNADFAGLTLGRGLAFDSDGNLCVDFGTSAGGWAYQDSGYDVIPAAPLIYVDDTHFYQPVLNATLNDMFDTPPGVMEFWMKGDIFITSDIAAGDVFIFGYRSKANSSYAAFGNSATRDGYYGAAPSTTRLGYYLGGGVSAWAIGLDVTKNTENHFLFHAVSHPSAGYIELTLNYGTFRQTGNVHDGNPFDTLFVYSNSEHALFSNFQVSATQLTY